MSAELNRNKPLDFNILRIVSFLSLVLISSCSTTGLNNNPSFEYAGCYDTASEVNATILANNLSLYEGDEFDMSKFQTIVLNPTDKKTIDEVDYYYFGYEDSCITTVPVKDNIVQNISVGWKDNDCLSYARRSIDIIGVYQTEYSGFTPFRDEYCGFFSLYKRIDN